MRAILRCTASTSADRLAVDRRAACRRRRGGRAPPIRPHGRHRRARRSDPPAGRPETRSAAAMSRTRNSKFGSSYFFISRGSRGEVSSLTETSCGLPSRGPTVSFDGRADLVLADQRREQIGVGRLRRLDRVAVERGDDVADLRARRRSGAAEHPRDANAGAAGQVRAARRARASAPAPTPAPRPCALRARDPRARPRRPRRPSAAARRRDRRRRARNARSFCPSSPARRTSSSASKRRRRLPVERRR